MDIPKIDIFDTTLRDGEQSPGVSLSAEEKLILASQLARLQVDVIEAGFPITSDGDFKSVQQIARKVNGPTIAALARINKEDINSAYKAVKDSSRPRIHVFVSTSDIHIQSQLKTSKEKVIASAKEAVAYTASLGVEVEFSPMDATRSDLDFMLEVCSTAIKEGAKIINLPDTVGYSIPAEYGNMFQLAKKELAVEKNGVKLSAHTHNDLGLAVANSLAAIEAGATQIECSVNGIGERAGNCSLEELVMALHTRSDLLAAKTNINFSEIAKTSRLVSRYTGFPIQANKPVVGKNAFSHESGIHQDGVLKNRNTYEIMDPELIGVENDQIVLGKHSGRHALKQTLEQLGYFLNDDELNFCFKKFKEIADRKKHITLLDIEALVVEQTNSLYKDITLEWFEVLVSSNGTPKAEVIIKNKDQSRHESATGDGAMDALFAAISKALDVEANLIRYNVSAVSEGEDSLAEAVIGLEIPGSSLKVSGQAIDSDTIRASGEAYLRALVSTL